MGYFNYPAQITGKEQFLALAFLVVIALIATVVAASKKRATGAQPKIQKQDKPTH